ncbi:hypothetical protein EDD17DRAFT_1486802 [Pisolithus thermaeus]|nr:hypothetical protein EV401DRAFT_1864573 [Pisolithus croceorrhizus]KAI6159465.1 hypothetical protein EDD17DRAFT_1486802 [Pisolithus thermaeus]
MVGHPDVLFPLAKWDRSRPGPCERFEGFMYGKEFCNAYAEPNDPFKKSLRFEEQSRQEVARRLMRRKLPTKCFSMREYLFPTFHILFVLIGGFFTALGLRPSGGWGMGIDRLVTFLTD